MKCQNNVVLAVLSGVVVGVLLGAGSAQYAQLVAYQAFSPDYAKTAQDSRENPQIYRQRSDKGFYVLPMERTAEQAEEDVIHRAAPAETLDPNCAVFSGRRRALCEVNSANDKMWYPTYN